MNVHRLFALGALALSPAIVAPAPAQADEVDDLGRALDSALRGGSYHVDPQRFNGDRALETIKKVEEILAKLEKAKPDAPKLADGRKALDEYRVKYDEALVKSVKDDFDREMSNFDRADRDFNDPSGRKDSGSAEAYTRRGGEVTARAAKKVEEQRAKLVSEKAQAFLAEVDARLADAKTKLAYGALVLEARMLLRDTRIDTPNIGSYSLISGIEGVNKQLDREDPERALEVWDATKKTVIPLRAAKFAELEEVKAALAEFATLEARVAKELKPMLAKSRTGPLIDKAKGQLDWLKTATDETDADKALQARAKLREECVELRREWSDVPEVKEFLEKVDAAVAESDDTFGDKLAITEIEAAEKQVKPALERLVRAIDRKSTVQAVRYGPAVREKKELLRPYADKSRAKNLLDRCEQTLVRLEKELGEKVAQMIADESWWPKVDVDMAWPSDVQQACLEINESVKRMREEYDEKQAQFEEYVDLDRGENSHRFGTAAEGVERAAKSIVRNARNMEKQGEALAKLDKKNPGVEVVAKAVPRLIKKVNAWKDLAAKKAEYAGKIGAAVGQIEYAQEAAKKAQEGSLEDASGQYGWPQTIEKADQALKALDEAAKILPDDKNEADEWAAKAKSLRAEAEKGLVDACMRGGSEAAIKGDKDRAERFASALKEALPASPENEKLAKIIAGSADARVKCEAEIASRGDLLQTRAAASSQVMREKFDAWRAEKAPQVLLAGTILANLDKWKGKHVEGKYRWFGETFGEDTIELNGEIYSVSYAPEVSAGCEAAMKRLSGLQDRMVAAVQKKSGVPPFPSTRGFGLQDAEFVCEIVGATSYTPVHQVKDQDGRIIGSISGTPYQVPRVVIRGITTKYYTVIPGVGASIDSFDESGIVP